jgi:hypothetical protein
LEPAEQAAFAGRLSIVRRIEYGSIEPYSLPLLLLR